MTKKTHVAAGLVVTAGVMIIAKEVSVPCAFGIVGAIIPDWDMILGMKHRGISHSFVFATILGCVFALFNSIFALSFMLNYCIHIALDSCTVMKVSCYYPFSKERYGLGLIKTGGAEDLFLCIVLLYAFSEMIKLI